MQRKVFYFSIVLIFFAYSRAEAANSINWTFYGPGAAGWMQGPMTASQKDAEGSSNGIHTLDDVRTGKSKYVTLASASVMKGRYFCIGTVTYTSPPGNGGDGKTHTIENVVGYIHDTGCAFNGTCSCARLPQYCDGRARTDKMDIAVGNFNGYSADYAMKYITKNPNRAPKDWTQIAGIPQSIQSGQSSTAPCGGQVKEEGTPVAAAYIPPATSAPQNQLPPPSSYTPQQQQSYQTSPYQAQSAPTGVSSGALNSGSSGLGSAVSGGTVTSSGSDTGPYSQQAYTTPVPQNTADQARNSQNPMLNSLFQQSSATSGIRIVQHATQALLDLFTVPSTSDSQNSRSAGTTPSSMHMFPRGQNPVLTPVYDNSNVSLMSESQLDDSRPTGTVRGPSSVSSQQPRPDSLDVSVQATRPVSTFGAPSSLEPTNTMSPATASAFATILSSFQSLISNMLRSFARR